MSALGHSGQTGLDSPALAPEPSVAAERARLAFRVCDLLADRGWLEPAELAAELGTTTAEAMFAVRELERAGLVRVLDAAPVEPPPEPMTAT